MLGVLWNVYFDHLEAFSSDMQFRCAKSCADALIGMLVHDHAADTIKIGKSDVRKVCADALNASTARIAVLYGWLPTCTPPGSCAGVFAGMSVFVSVCASCVAASVN